MLSIAFGRAGQRALLVDCDLGLANVDVQLGVRPQADVHSVVRGFLELDAAVTPVHGRTRPQWRLRPDRWPFGLGRAWAR